MDISDIYDLMQFKVHDDAPVKFDVPEVYFEDAGEYFDDEEDDEDDDYYTSWLK